MNICPNQEMQNTSSEESSCSFTTKLTVKTNPIFLHKYRGREKFIPHARYQWCLQNHQQVKQRLPLKQIQLEPHQWHYPIFHKPKGKHSQLIQQQVFSWEDFKIRTNSTKTNVKGNNIPNGANHEVQCFQYTFLAFSWQGLGLPIPNYIRQASEQQSRTKLIKTSWTKK